MPSRLGQLHGPYKVPQDLLDFDAEFERGQLAYLQRQRDSIDSLRAKGLTEAELQPYIKSLKHSELHELQRRVKLMLPRPVLTPAERRANSLKLLAETDAKLRRLKGGSASPGE